MFTALRPLTITATRGCSRSFRTGSSSAEGENPVPKVVAGVVVRDGTEVAANPDYRAA